VGVLEREIVSRDGYAASVHASGELGVERLSLLQRVHLTSPCIWMILTRRRRSRAVECGGNLQVAGTPW
jgi:hypothetical protein